jgi:glycosyltransferase involved in cell wall biosynthesis
MTEPLVSVKMITYNHAPFIARAIEGVLQQKTNFPFELLIGEDCSTDGTREIVFEYQKKYSDVIRVITSERNTGGWDNSERARKACRGKYAAFCEGDDYWHHPGKLQKQADYLESHPECGLVFADCDVYDDKADKLIGSFNYHRGFQSPANLTIEEIIDHQGIVQFTCTAMIRRNLYEQVVGADPYLHQSGEFLMGDAQLWAELAAISGVSYIPESLGTYRFREESASRSKDPIKYFRFWKSVYECKLYLCDKYNLSESVRREYEATWCDRALRLAFHERNVALALEVKKKKQTFTWEEWLQYVGAKYLAIHYGYRGGTLLVGLFIKCHNQWRKITHRLGKSGSGGGTP